MGKYDLETKVFPKGALDGNGNQVSLTVSGAPRAVFRYAATFGTPTLTQVVLTKTTETDAAWAARLSEMGTLVNAINASQNGTAHAALLVRIQAID